MRISFAHVVSALASVGLLFAGLPGCADAPVETDEPTDPGVGSPDSPNVGGIALGQALASCSTAGSSGYDADTKALDLTLSGDEIVLAVVEGKVAVNHNPCVDLNDVALTPTSVKTISITGSTGDEEIIIDLAQGSFGAILSTSGGISIDMGDSIVADSFKVRGSNSGTDRFTVGEDNGIAYFELSGDKNADVKVESADSFVVALGDGNDIFTAQGGAISANHLTDGVTSLSALTTAITVNGGAGNDTITGGAGDDTLSGGEGDDTFETAATDDGADTYNGSGGTDTMDYSSRTGDLTVTLDGTGNDGLASETDDVKTDVENVIGGAGDDTITGSDVSNEIEGGAGADTLSGGTGNSDCSLDADVLYGNDGDDTFDQGSASDCGDVLNGGAGIDIADYSARTVAVTVIVNSQADDGEGAEADNVKSDVETIKGGAGDDTLTGGSGDETFVGGAGADTMSGGSGDDTFDMGSAAAGADVINGGRDFDTVDYSARTNDLTVTLCVDDTATTGASTVCTSTDDGEASGDGAGVFNVEHVIAGAGADTLTGAESDDTLEGKDGDDTISGGAGSDSLFGDAGDDDISGGDDDDYCDGGADQTAGTNIDGDAGDGDICTQVGLSVVGTCEL